MHRTSARLPRIGLVAITLALALFAARAIPAFAAAPTVTNISPTTGSSAGGTLVTITGTNFTGTTAVTFGGINATSYDVVDDTHITATAPAHAVGLVDIIVTNDGASANTSADDFTYVPNPVPVITSISPTSGPTTGGTTVTINGSGLTGATVSFGGTPVGVFNASDTQLQVLSPAHAAGTVSISATTPGGTSANTDADNFTYNTPGPAVTGVSPSGGPVGGGTSVTITGTGLTGATQVTFGGVPGTGLVVNSDTSITVVSPAHAAGTVNVLVTTPVGTSTNTAADDFTYGNAPTITGISPNVAPVAGGVTVTITGTNLTGATAVSFGGTAGTGIEVVDANTVTVVAPAHAVGTVNVTITTPAGTSADTAADDFNYSAAPFITSITPTGGSIAGGTVVTITGTGFTGVTAVSFGGTAATTFTVNSNTQITATAPAHAAGSVDIVVTSPNGSSANTTADNFLYGAAPTITSISPTQGPTAGGTTVTITGTGFTGATAVKFGATAATSFTVVSDTQITAVTPVGVNGVVDVSVVTPLGTSANTAADNFTYGTGNTVTFTLYFRWTLIVWNGKDNADVAASLKNLENPDNPATNDISSAVTAIFHYNNPLQKFEGWFPGGANIPGANDFSVFKTGEPYWIAITTSGSLTWTVPGA